MFKIRVSSLCGLALLCCGAAAMAQDDDATAYVYGTYLICNSADLGTADEITELVMAPAYDAAVESGDILSWGWMAHHTGGTWRRLLYHTASTLEALLAASDSIGEATDEAAPALGRVFAEACPSHDDYIWMTVEGSGGQGAVGERGTAGLSTYFECDPSRETRADEIVAQSFGAIHQKQVDAGNLTSWGWLQHHTGGKYRRLLTLTGPDHNTILKGRDAIVEEISSGRNERLSTEFDSICSSHTDYMWNIQHEMP